MAQSATTRNIKRRRSPSVICFVGISNKPGEDGLVSPLCETTLSGKIISKVEAKLRAMPQCSEFYRDNLVANAPLSNGKLRYPTLFEMRTEWKSFERRLTKVKTNIVILLGQMVSEFFKSKRKLRIMKCPYVDGHLVKWAGVDTGGGIVLSVAHPSYVGVYARKRIGDYAEAIFRALETFLEEMRA